MKKSVRKINKTVAQGLWNVGDVIMREENLTEDDFNELAKTLRLYEETFQISRSIQFPKRIK